MTDAYSYTPFGGEIRQQGGSDQPYVYHGTLGVERERRTSLIYMRQRYYDSASARFLSRDPFQSANPLAVNLYAFALNNPLSFSDPSGLAVSYDNVRSDTFDDILLGATRPNSTLSGGLDGDTLDGGPALDTIRSTGGSDAIRGTDFDDRLFWGLDDGPFPFQSVDTTGEDLSTRPADGGSPSTMGLQIQDVESSTIGSTSSITLDQFPVPFSTGDLVDDGLVDDADISPFRSRLSGGASQSKSRFDIAQDGLIDEPDFSAFERSPDGDQDDDLSFSDSQRP